MNKTQEREMNNKTETSAMKDENTASGIVKCNACWVEMEDKSAKQCVKCNSVIYCGKECQRQHWNNHKAICNAISTLKKKEAENCERACSFPSHLSPKKESKLASIIGKQCLVKAQLNGIEAQILWDTGSQVSLVSSKWLKLFHPHLVVEKVTNLLGKDIDLEAVGGGSIPYNGYVAMRVELGTQKPITVPFLVTTEKIDQPIIGYNVIAEFSNRDETLPDGTFLGLDDHKVCEIVACLRENDEESLSSVKSNKFSTVIRAGTSISIPCKIKTTRMLRDAPVLFQPLYSDNFNSLAFHQSIILLKKGIRSRIFITVENTGKEDVWIPARTLLGSLEMIRSMTPGSVKPKSTETTSDKDAGDEEKLQVCSLGTGTTEDDEYRKLFDTLELQHLNEEQQSTVKDMLWTERHAFSKDPDDIGDSDDLKLTVKTVDEVPVQKRYNTVPKQLYTEVKHHIEDLYNRGWIQTSKSAWSSPIVVVRKKDGSIRLCCDFRALNKKTIPDQHPLPRIQSALDNLGGSELFSVLDQSRAYYQGRVSEDTQHKTAFITPWGLWEWVRIPFGLMNAPATFQRHMEESFSDYRDKFALPYLDDIIAYSKTFDDHVNHVQKILQRIKEKKLKLNLNKCDLFKSEVKYLGRIVSKNGHRMDNQSIEAVRKLKDQNVPKTIGELRQILGLLSYHRRYVQNFAKLSKPLSDLLVVTDKNNEKGVSSKTPINWTDKEQTALERLIIIVTNPPILAYPDYSNKADEFFVHTDASGEGLGCILYQKQNGAIRTIAYGSRSLLPAEKKYHSTKLEYLALKWAITEKFSDYLGYANHFTAYTDNNPLLYIMETSKMNANGQRWVSALSEFNFTIKYRSGIENKDADCLSRMPLDIENYIPLYENEVSPDAFRAIMMGIKVQADNEEIWKSPVMVGKVENQCDAEVLSMSCEELRKLQVEDSDISTVYNMVKSGVKNLNTTPKVKALLRHWKNLFITEKGLLYRKTMEHNQLVLPDKLKPLVYQHLHAEMGHLGPERTYELARERVYWVGMRAEIEAFINERCPCIARKKPHFHQSAPQQTIITSAPMEIVAIDYLHLESSSSGCEYILMITDHFTRYTQAYATRDKSSRTAAKHLYDDFILRFGIPKHILHDQGKEFENNLFADIEKVSGIKKLRTTPYHPQCNGAVERMNRTILQMLRSLESSQKKKWHTSLNKVVFAYNSTKHDSTNYSPFFLMFGRKPRLPIDFILGGEKDEADIPVLHTKYAQEWKEKMDAAYAIASKNALARKELRMKRHRGKLAEPLAIGDKVLVRNVETGGPGKLRSYWVEEVYIVKHIKNNGVVYTVCKEDGSGEWTVHRNMLLPCSHLILPAIQEPVRKDSRRETRSMKQTRERRDGQQLINESESDSDEEIEMFIIPKENDKDVAPGDDQLKTHQDEADLVVEPKIISQEMYNSLFNESVTDEEEFTGFDINDNINQQDELAEPATGKSTVQSNGLKWKQAAGDQLRHRTQAARRKCPHDLPMVEDMIEKWKKRYNKLVKSKDA